MDYFIGSKIIKARPMSRIDYNNYRGWELPDYENGADEGFLVEYLDGGEANHKDHAGYISWSPKEVFENAYLPVGDLSEKAPHQQRVICEHAELATRLQKLNDFLFSEAFNKLEKPDRISLAEQRDVMGVYLSILNQRISRF